MHKNLHKTLRFLVSIAFLASSFSVSKVQAGEIIVPLMPKPGTIVNLSPFYSPAYLNGVVIHPDNALQFDFLIHKGDGNLDLSQKNEEYTKLVKYFLASLTIPDEDQWVNLSPYEHDRIIKDSFGKTEMGRDLLSQDYLLKQITSSLMYPESGLGKNFWDKVYERAYQEFGNANVPVNTFNKVWIVPDEALVYESGNTAYVVKSHLKVMLEEDYLSLEKHAAVTEIPNKTHAMSSKIVKEIILPQIEKEVNEGKNFAQLRQIFSGMVLATWYKRALRESLLGKVYADKAKVAGVNQDPTNNEKIYQQYLVAFKKGVYNYIKEDVDKYTNQIIPRKYFSGGFVNQAMKVLEVRKGVSERDMAQAVSAGGLIDDEDRATVALAGKGEKLAIDRAMNTAATIMKDLRPEQKRTLGIPYRHAEFQDLQQNFLAGSFVRNVPLELTRFPGLETQSTVPDKKIVFDTVEKTSPTTSVKKAIYFNEVVAAGNKTYAIGYENVAEGMPYLRIFVREEGQIAWKLLVRTEGVEYNDQVVIVPHELQTALNQLQEQSAANPLGIFRVEDQKVAAFQADVLAKSDLLGKEFFTPQSSRVRYNENSKEHQPDLTTVINVDHIAQRGPVDCLSTG